MFPLFLIATLVSLNSFAAELVPSPSPSPSGAPASNRLVDQLSAADKTKATELWNQAMEKFAARAYKAAAPLLSSYVEKYPATPEAIDARYSLAQSYLFSKEAGKAIPYFTSVIEIRGRSTLGNEARTYLGQAYLDESKFTEAYLVSEELLTQETLGTTFRAKALLLRAHAQAGLKQNSEAEKTLIAFQTIAESDPELELETASSFLVTLLLKANHCDALPSAKALPEDQLLDQISRKSICVLEMATMLAKASKKLGRDELASSEDALMSSITHYRKECEQPSIALPAKINAQKSKIARSELSEKLFEGYKSMTKLLIETFRERESLKPLVKKIEKNSL